MSLERSIGKGFWRILFVFFNTRCLVVFSGALLLYKVEQTPLYDNHSSKTTKIESTQANSHTIIPV